MIKTFDELAPGDKIIIPGYPKSAFPNFRVDQEYTVEIKHPDKTVKVEELGGVVIQMKAYNVKD